MNVFTSFEMLAAVYPSQARKSNETMPYVTIDDFDAIASRVRQISKASYVFFKAILSGMDEVDRWNDYTAGNKHWIAEGRPFATYENDEVISDVFPLYVFWPEADNKVPVNSSGKTYCPLWQFSPVPASLNISINFDPNIYPSSRASAAYVEATGKHSMTEPNPVIRKMYKVQSLLRWQYRADWRNVLSLVTLVAF